MIINNSNITTLFIKLLFFFYGLGIVLFDNTKYLALIYLLNVIIGCVFVNLVLTSKIKIYTNIFFNIYILFILLAIVSAFWSIDFFYSARRSLNLVLIFTNLFFIYNINKKFKSYKFLIYGILTSLVVNFLWLIGILDLGLKYEGWRFPGSVLQVNNFVFILVTGMMMITSFIIDEKSKKVFKTIMYLLLIMIMYLIFFTASKAGLFSGVLLLLIIILLSLNYKNLVSIIIVGCIAYITISYTTIIKNLVEDSTLDLKYTYINLENRINDFFLNLGNESYSQGSTSQRIKLIQDGITMWADYPVFGNGMAAFEIVHGHYSHNNYLDLLVSFGIIGFTMYYLLYIYLFIDIFKIQSIKTKFMHFSFLIIFLFFDLSIVSYTGKFKVLALLIFYLSIKESIRKKSMIYEN